MAGGNLRKRIFEEDTDSHEDGGWFKDRVYELGQDTTLADVDLERGDALPDDSDYEIVSSKIVSRRGGRSRVAVVRAMKEQAL